MDLDVTLNNENFKNININLPLAKIVFYVNRIKNNFSTTPEDFINNFLSFDDIIRLYLKDVFIRRSNNLAKSIHQSLEDKDCSEGNYLLLADVTEFIIHELGLPVNSANIIQQNILERSNVHKYNKSLINQMFLLNKTSLLRKLNVQQHPLFLSEKLSIQDQNLTPLGRQLKVLCLQRIKDHINDEKDNGSSMYLINSAKDLFRFNLDSLINDLANSLINNANLDEAYVNDVYLFIEKIIFNYIKSYRKDDKNVNFFKNEHPKIIKEIYEELPDFINEVKFAKHKNGYYTHTWLDSDKDQRWDAKPIFKFLRQNRNLANEIVSQALGLSLKDFEQNFLPWDVYISELINNPNLLEKFHLYVRNLLVNRNFDVARRKADEINKINDPIVLLNDKDEFVDENGKPLVKDQSIVIDFNPRDDSQREKPIVVFKEKVNDKIKNRIIIGRPGQNHGSIITRFLKRISGLQTWICAYLIGNVAILDHDRCKYNSLNEVVEVLKRSNKFSKVYVIDDSNPKCLHRLAKKLH